jgi:hypothetical protein
VTTAFADGVPEAETSVFLALRTRDWLSPEDLMTRAAVAEDTARAWCERFWQMGLVARRGAYPDYRYRALRVPLHDAGRAYLKSIPEQNRLTSAIPMPATPTWRRDSSERSGSSVTASVAVAPGATERSAPTPATPSLLIRSG